MSGVWRFHCGLMPANLITLPPFSVSSTISLANWAKEFFESGQTILWIETQNTVAFLRPVRDILVWTPCPTACLAESLRLRQVRLAAQQLLSQLLLLGHRSGELAGEPLDICFLAGSDGLATACDL